MTFHHAEPTIPRPAAYASIEALRTTHLPQTEKMLKLGLADLPLPSLLRVIGDVVRDLRAALAAYKGLGK